MADVVGVEGVVGGGVVVMEGEVKAPVVGGVDARTVVGVCGASERREVSEEASVCLGG